MKGGQNGEKVHEFHFRLGIYLHSYFRAICALLEDFEIVDYFDRILMISRPLKVDMTRLGQKFEL